LTAKFSSEASEHDFPDFSKPSVSVRDRVTQSIETRLREATLSRKVHEERFEQRQANLKDDLDQQVAWGWVKRNPQ